MFVLEVSWSYPHVINPLMPQFFLERVSGYLCPNDQKVNDCVPRNSPYTSTHQNE